LGNLLSSSAAFDEKILLRKINRNNGRKRSSNGGSNWGSSNMFSFAFSLFFCVVESVVVRLMSGKCGKAAVIDKAEWKDVFVHMST